ncbi:hypothetical protein C8Q72DRAFT_201066 [Fomitopsis betulina]|nr:hypothetical protein C8Q72DRAFT_201066 [Fomitopsis betulina]
MSFRCAHSDRVDDEAVTPLNALREDVMQVDGCPPVFDVLDMETGLLTVLDVEEVDTETIFVPQPKYEACTPSSQIIATDDIPDWLAFISYADEPGFPWHELLRSCKYWFWKDCIRDPDANLFSHNKEKGLISGLYNRDFLWGWPETSALPPKHFCGYDGTENHIHEYVEKLCQHTGCLYYICLPHMAPPFPGKTALVKSEDIKKSIKKACSDSCCLMQRDVIEEPTLEDATLIQAVLGLMPDDLPCQVSVIVKAPCYQVFLIRSQLFPDQCIGAEIVHAAPRITFADTPPEEYDPPGVDFCYHQGPCGHQCTCFNARTRCKRGCRCDLMCRYQVTICCM